MEDTKEQFSYSYNEETYQGSCATREEAVSEAAMNEPKDRTFWTGRCVPPTPPELLWDAESWLEHVSCQDDYCGDHADGWDDSTKGQREELEADVRKLLAAWLDKHDLRPAFYTVEDVQKHVIVDVVNGIPEVECL